jgi:4-hydroxy-tetrahydrodipicolinate synthase
MLPLADDAFVGSYVPLVTPLRDGSIDLDAYARLVDVQVTHGSRGIVVCGTTGEPSTLTAAERADLTRVAVEQAAGRIDVVAATGGASLAETLALSEAAERAGAAALLVVTPYYIKPPQRGLVEYFVRVCASTSLPVLIYHIPGRAGVAMMPASVASVAARSANLVGIKHASPDLHYVTQLLSDLGSRFRVFVGLEEFSYPMLAIGACGLMNAVGNIAPAEVAALCAAVASGQADRARQAHYRLAQLNAAVFWDTNPIPVKYLMWRLGLLATDEHRLPMAPPDKDLAQRLDDLLGTDPVLLSVAAELAARTSGRRPDLTMPNLVDHA